MVRLKLTQIKLEVVIACIQTEMSEQIQAN